MIPHQINRLLFQTDYLSSTNIFKLNYTQLTRTKKKLKALDTNKFEKFTKNVLENTSCEVVLKQYGVIKRIINNNSIPNVYISKKESRYSNFSPQRVDSNHLDKQWHKRMTRVFHTEKKQAQDKKPQNIFYINEYLQSIDELHTYQGFSKTLDREYEKSKKENAYFKFMRQHAQFPAPDNKKLMLIQANRNYNVLKEFLRQKN